MTAGDTVVIHATAGDWRFVGTGTAQGVVSSPAGWGEAARRMECRVVAILCGYGFAG